jgi:hypothetical protein
MLLKGSIGTPLARWGGSTLQRLGWGTASGYYTGIGAVTVVLGSWQVYDLFIFARDTRQTSTTATSTPTDNDDDIQPILSPTGRMTRPSTANKTRASLERRANRP